MEKKMISALLGLQTRHKKKRMDRSTVLKRYMRNVAKLQKERYGLEKKISAAEKRINAAVFLCYGIAKAAKKLNIGHYMDTDIEIRSNKSISLKYRGKDILRAKRVFKDDEISNSVQRVAGKAVSDALLQKLKDIHKRLNTELLTERMEQNRLKNMMEMESSVKERKKKEKALKEEIRKLKGKNRSLRL